MEYSTLNHDHDLGSSAAVSRGANSSQKSGGGGSRNNSLKSNERISS
jgi:hypothetical protein